MCKQWPYYSFQTARLPICLYLHRTIECKEAEGMAGPGPCLLCRSPDTFLTRLVGLPILPFGTILLGVIVKTLFQKISSLRSFHIPVLMHKSSLFPTEDNEIIALMYRCFPFFLHNVYYLSKHKGIPNTLALYQHTGHSTFMNRSALIFLEKDS